MCFSGPPAPFPGVAVKKGPQNPISVVGDQCGGTRDQLTMTDPPSGIMRCPQPGMPSPGCPAAGAGAVVARTVAVRVTVPPSRCPPGSRPAWRGGHRHTPAHSPVPGAAAVPALAGLTGGPEWRVDACGPGRQASPPHRPLAGRAAPSVTARDPAPAPAGLPLRRAISYRGPCPRLAPISRSARRQLRPGRLCGGGLDGAGGAERAS